MKVVFTILIFLSFAIGLNCQTNKTKPLTVQELDVYKTVLGEKPKEIVVIEESLVDVFGEISTGGLKEILNGLQDDTFENFAIANKTQTKIDDEVRSSFDFLLMSRTDFEGEDLKPDGYYVFSRVGFSNDGKQAVVMFIDARNPLGRKGAYFLLENKNGFWKIAQESEAWRS